MADIDIILNLQNNGPAIFESLEKSSDESLISYQKLYLLDRDLFPDGLAHYINYIKNNDTNIWNNISTLLTNEEIIHIINNTMDILVEDSYNQKMQIIIKIISTPKIKELLGSDNNLWNTVFKPLIETIKLNNSSWIDNITHLQLNIENLIKDKNIRSKFIIWISETLNKCIKKIHIDVNNYDNSCPSDYYISNILSILLLFWNTGINVTKILKLDYNYILSDKCHINWLTKTIKKDDQEYTFLNQCLFLIFHAIRVGYSPIINRTKKWPKLLKSLEDNVETINNTNSVMGQYFINNIKKQIKVVKEYIEIDTIIESNKYIKKWITDFYGISSIWMKENKGKLLDDFLSDMSYLLNHISLEEYILDDNFSNILVDMISTKDYTNNITLKYDILDVCHKFILEDPYITHSNLDKISICLLTLFCELNNSIIRTDYKFIKKIKIYSLLDHYYLREPKTKDILLFQLINNPDLLKKFMNITFMDMCDVNDTIDTFYDQLDNYSSENENSDDENSIDNILYNLYSSIEFYIKMINFTDKLLLLLTSIEQLSKIIFSKEIFSSLALVLNTIINKLSKRIKNEFPNEPHTDYQININDLIKSLSSIFKNIFCHHLNNLNIIVEDHNFDINCYNDFKKLAHIDFNYILLEFIKIKDNIDKELKALQEDDMDIPSEFLDPITYCLIENPCLLPGLHDNDAEGLFFETSTIIKQLLIKEENPYNRQQLTLKQLEEFNSTPSVLEKIKTFKLKLDDWLNNKKQKKIK